MEANARDVEQAKRAGLSGAMIDRLALTDRRIDDLIRSLGEIAAQEDPVGEISGVRRPQGFVLEGAHPHRVVAMIYESRPNVTVDAAALCLSGNAVILRGSEAMEATGPRLLDPAGSRGRIDGKQSRWWSAGRAITSW
jgi:glutamate-5-semialdehyde dehydrogenase